MNRKKLFISILFVSIIFVSSAVYLEAAQKVLNLSMIAQEQNQWCWAACSQSYIRYKTGNLYSQSSIVTYIFGSPVNQPGTGDQIERVCIAGGASASQYGRISFGDIVWLSDNNRPFIIGRSGHATVGFGYYNTNGSEYVAIADPWPGVGKKWQTYSYYSSGWFLTVL